MGRWNNLFCSGGGGSIAYILDSAIVKGPILVFLPSFLPSALKSQLEGASGERGLLKIKLLGKCDWGAERGGRANGFLSQREAAAVDKTSPAAAVLFGVRCFSLLKVAGGREDEGEGTTHT